MKENLFLSQFEELANKYSLQIHHWGWTTRFDLKLDGGGLLLARIDYNQTDDSIMNVQMPDRYVLSFRGDKMRYIMSDGWISIPTLKAFENHTIYLIENYKKCLVEQRKDFLENDFD